MSGYKCVECSASFKQSARFCPYCGVSARSMFVQHRKSREGAGTIERAKEISFENMCATDFILIQTRNSTYRFSVVDPLARRGVLTEGRFGANFCDAILMGVLVEGIDGITRDPSGLKTESRALFYIEDEMGLKRMTTSTITSLILVRGSAEPAFS
ncbi:MAG TPA: zinc ribbon domain-containing protein [Blastocatellia bacterium]|nr:zinc ribbon domain-containing protein [Blastocatellia bacterium]